MDLFPARLVEKTHRLPGAQHSFLKQLCAPEAADTRVALQALLARAPLPLAERASSLMGSLDNRRFFQGYAELVVLDRLAAAGWTLVQGQSIQPRFEVQHPDAGPLLVVTLATLQCLRPGGEAHNRARLSEALGRIDSPRRFVALIRRWLPTDLDPWPVRRAVELWLDRVDAGQWDGTTATYEDESISLEFSLTGERVQRGQVALADVIGPFYAHRTMEAIEPRIVRELDAHRHSPPGRAPLLVVCVSDARWLINEAHIRDFLYGCPSRVSSSPERWEMEVPSAPGGACVFRDPVYRGVAGVVLAHQAPETLGAAGGGLAGRGWLNPWCAGRPDPERLPFPLVAPVPGRSVEGVALLRRYGGRS